MKRQTLLFFLVAAILSSCTTAYRTGQTPDDVYFSPQRPQDEYVRTDERKDGKYQYNDDYYDDRYLHMKVSNRLMWSDLNDWYYYDRYSYGYNYYYGTYYNPYNSWNYYYNPYCPRPVVFVNPKNGGNPSASNYPKYVAPGRFSLASYTNNGYNNSNLVSKSGKPIIIRPGITPSNSTSGSGNNSALSQKVNKWFTGNSNSSGSIYNNSNSNSGNSGSRPTRSYTPSNSSSGSSSSGSSGSSSGGGGGVSRPTRGGH